jgi:hypothetical protein
VRNTFESWNIKLLTEREEKETPRPRGRRPKDAPTAPTEVRYRYELLIVYTWTWIEIGADTGKAPAGCRWLMIRRNQRTGEQAFYSVR